MTPSIRARFASHHLIRTDKLPATVVQRFRDLNNQTSAIPQQIERHQGDVLEIITHRLDDHRYEALADEHSQDRRERDTFYAQAASLQDVPRTIQKLKLDYVTYWGDPPKGY
jgi:hypothetical protein